MKYAKDKKGFTLVEMLVVIAIIAVLVAIIIPTVMSATTKAKAATDAANLRSVLGQANNAALLGHGIESAKNADIEVPPCKSYPSAKMQLLFVYPGFIDVYYVDGDNYYTLDYFSDLAENGKTEISAAAPSTADYDNAEWYTFGE